MDYNEKYIKYKNKYINLKNSLPHNLVDIVGGFDNKIEHVGGFDNKIEHIGGFDNKIEHVGGFVNKIETVNENLLKIIFPKPKNIKNFNYNKLQVTSEGLFSVSKVKASTILVNLIKQYMNNNKKITVTDATANNGSDTINLALNFHKINAIELDPLNYRVLKNNVDTYKLKNVDIYNDDSLNMLNKLEQDVIYMDAPWGGSDYKSKDVIDLYMSKTEIADVYKLFKDKCKLFIFKVPYNYNFSNFSKIKHTIKKVDRGNKKPFYFIIIQL
jgi:predicted RNA methylase